MNADKLLGIDIGTYESKGVITDFSGRILAYASRQHELALPQPGWAEHDPESVWWQDFVEISQELIRESAIAPNDIAAIGCSAIAPCVLPVDKDGHPLRPGILYGIDTRAVKEIYELTNVLGEDWIIQQAGSALSSQSAGPKILWIQRNEPDVWEKTRRVMTSTSFLVYRLTNRVVMDHYTATTYAPIYSLQKVGWTQRGLDSVCDEALLPELDWTTAMAGRVTAQASMETGLAAGTPVIVGTADAAAEAVSAGVVHPGDTMLMYGSTMFFIELCKTLPEGGVLWPAVYLAPGMYALAAGMATTGSLTRWFRDEFAPLELSSERQDGPNAFAALADQASDIQPGCNGLLVLPYFSGERTPLNDPYARGVFAGLTLSHSRSHIYRAILEGIAYGIRQNLEAMTEAGQTPQSLIAIGGGTKNRLWLQIVSDVTGLPQNIRQTPGAAYGDAFLAGVGIGIFSDIASIQNWLEPAEQIHPDRKLKKLYDEYYSLYKELYISNKGVAHRLARLGG